MCILHCDNHIGSWEMKMHDDFERSLASLARA